MAAQTKEYPNIGHLSYNYEFAAKMTEDGFIAYYQPIWNAAGAFGRADANKQKEVLKGHYKIITDHIASLQPKQPEVVKQNTGKGDK